jgi:hypothetical protein
MVGAGPPSHEEHGVENSPTPAETDFERLLSATPAIARAIKQFDDPETRRAMFDHLVSALLGVERRSRPTDD